MIIGIGIDSIEIERFALWHTYSHKQLARIFSPEEIEYCCAIQHKSAERFAVRFAAREAFFKALAHGNHQSMPFLAVCKKMRVIRNAKGAPVLLVDWHAFFTLLDTSPDIFLSLTHTQSVATAMVVLATKLN